MASTLLAVGLLYFLAHLLSNTFDRSRIPDVLVLMLIGILVGPVLHWTGPEAFGSVGRALTTIALAVILFESGTTLRLDAVFRSAGSTLAITLVSVLLTVIVVAGAAWAVLGLPWLSAIILGTIVCGTSSSVVIPMVRVLKVRENAAAVMILESAITDVLQIVLAFALITAAVQGEMNVGRMIGQTASSLLFATIIGVVGGLGWMLIWDRVRRLEATIFTTLAAAFVLYGAAELLGFAGAIAVLAFGVTLTNYAYFGLTRLFHERRFEGVTPVEAGFYKEIVFLLKTFFFVYLGISMQFNDWKLIVGAALVMLVLQALRLLITPVVLSKEIVRRDATVVAVMIPRGLAAAVLAGLPLEAGIEGGEVIQTATYGLVFTSIILVALVVMLKDTGPFRRMFDRVLAGFPVVEQAEEVVTVPVVPTVARGTAEEAASE